MSSLTFAQEATTEPQGDAAAGTDTTPAASDAAPAEAAPAQSTETAPAEAAASADTAGAQMTAPAADMTTAVAQAPVADSAEATEALPVAGYDKGFFIQSGDGAFKLKIGARIKTRFDFESIDPGEGDRKNTNSFSVPYARLYFSGHLFDKKLTYLFNPGFGGGNMKLVLAFVNYEFVKNALYLTFGQMKRPFSRNYLTSSGKRAFIDGPTGEFGNGVDLGLQFSNDFTKAEGLEWAIGLYNSAAATKPEFKASGTGTVDEEGNLDVSGKFSNAVEDFKPALALRLGYNTGIKGYYPTDFEGGGPRFGIALSAHTDFDANDSHNGMAYLSTDLILKVHGFSLNGGVYMGFAGKAHDDGESQYVWKDPEFSKLGAFAQLQFLIAGRFEPVFRYGMNNPDGDDNNTHELTLGFTIYIYGQNFKWENNFTTMLEDTIKENGDAETLANLAFKSQLQFLF